MVAYFFPLTREEALRRNDGRPATNRIPVPGILGTLRKLEPPRIEEGFDAVYGVRGERGRFRVRPSAGTAS